MFAQQEKHPAVMICCLALFAVAFAIVEGSVVHYLRLIYYPHGFGNEVPAIGSNAMIIEMTRELATLVMISMVSFVAAGSLVQCVSRFILVFSIWDIMYYFVLRIIEGWPKTLFDPDILFLIPVAWFAPVLVPICISAIGIMGALVVEYLHHTFSAVHARWESIALFVSALALWFLSFILPRPINGTIGNYHWFLFCAGVFVSLAGIVLLLKDNLARHAAE